MPTLALPAPSRAVHAQFARRPLIGVGRRVALLAVHHIREGGINYTGGAEKYIRQVVTALMESGAAVHVGYSGDSIYDDLWQSGDAGRLVLEQTGWLGPTLSGDTAMSLRSFLARRDWLRSTGADCVFVVQQAAGAAFFLSILAARSLGLRTVSTIRQMPMDVPPASALDTASVSRAAAKRWLGIITSPEVWRRIPGWRVRAAAACCDAVIFNSRRAADRFAGQHPISHHRIYIIPNGERVPPTIASRPRDPARTLGAIGRVSQAKGADTLLDAFEIVVRQHPDARLIYFGDGTFLAPLRERVRHSALCDRVEFAGHESDRDAIYRQIDICVHLSRRESMSNSVIEAMARGLPCVVSDVGGMGELVEHGAGGLLVPSDAPAAAADAILRLMADPALCRSLGQHARGRVLRDHDLTSVMRQTIAAILG